MSWTNIPGSSNEVPENLTVPNISLAEKIKARAENIAVQIQEIFPLEELHKILEEGYADLANGKSIGITLSALWMDPKVLMTKFPNITETKIADYIRDYLKEQWPRDGMKYEWSDVHTLASGCITCSLEQKNAIIK